jgi:hypothetical protein
MECNKNQNNQTHFHYYKNFINNFEMVLMLIHLASSHLCTCFMHQDNSNSHHVVITFVFNWIPKGHELLTNYVINFKSSCINTPYHSFMEHNMLEFFKPKKTFIAT